ncbi:MAG: sensor histidine kinase [Acidimicrobiales bacterium]
MANLEELAQQRSRLSSAETSHLQRLLGGWGLLADLSFSDLMLFGRDRKSGDEHALVVLGQIRPTTSQTLFSNDWVGRAVASSERPLVDETFQSGEITEGEISTGSFEGSVRELCIPVTFGGRTIAVLTKDAHEHVARQDGVLERTYLNVFHRFAAMVAAGDFPFADEDKRGLVMPRVGDGVMVLDSQQRVHFASPNAISALHRIGVHANSEGERFGEIGLPESPVVAAFALKSPSAEEIERGPNVTILLRIIPLVADDVVTGALVLMRDISELRRRDLMLLSKDATIREIHHRVKNNLQTISALLRLQGRRLSSPEAKAAVEESVRRIRSIALVHETLSTTIGDDVPFIEIVRPLVRMVEEGLISPERPIRFTVTGDAGVVPADVATPLAVVLTELLQNVVDHAFPAESPDDASVIIELENTGTRLRVTVTDNGVGTAPGFTIDDSAGLGLSIVRTLVTTELAGTIGFSAGEGTAERPGTAVRISVPVRH